MKLVFTLFGGLCILCPRLPIRIDNFRQIMDQIIANKEIQIERKRIIVELRENARGSFLRMTEEAGGRRNAIIVPLAGLPEFTAAIDEVLQQAGNIAPV